MIFFSNAVDYFSCWYFIKVFTVRTYSEQNICILFERPASESVLAGLASSCMFLVELQQQQLSVAVADLRQVIAVHSASHLLKDDVTRDMVSTFMLPLANWLLCIRSSHHGHNEAAVTNCQRLRNRLFAIDIICPDAISFN